jgi:hypothetical protein
MTHPEVIDLRFRSLIQYSNENNEQQQIGEKQYPMHVKKGR